MTGKPLANVRIVGELDKSDIKKIVEELDTNDIKKLFELHKGNTKILADISTKCGKNLRNANFPEPISENLVRQHIIKEDNVEYCKWSTKDSSGDLEVKTKDNTVKKIEVKCFSSTGPSSFGPTEKWDELYFVDAIEYMENKIKIYKVNISSSSELILNFEVKKGETFGQQCRAKRRPRFKFADFQKKFYNDVKLVFDGNIDTLLT